MSSSNEHNWSFSKEDIMKYHRGELDDSQMNEMEQRALDDPFLADAMEGWSSQSDTSIMDEVDGELESRMTDTGSSSSFSWVKTTLLSAAVVITAYAAYQVISDMNEVNVMTEQILERASQEEPPFIVSTQQDSIDEMEIKYSTPLPVEEHIDLKRVRKEMVPTPEVEKDGEPQKKTEPTPIPVKKKQELEKEEPSPKIQQKTHAVYYVHGLKVADYRKLRTKGQSEIAIWSQLSGHVPANYENDSIARLGGARFEVTKISYVDYLDAAMQRFAQGDYKEALKRYRVIMKNYPNDVNAHFYGGLAYFNLNRQKKAASYLSVAQKHDLSVFDQEAQYYRALSLIKAKKISAARYVLKNIVDKDSFYSSQALELLGNLN